MESKAEFLFEISWEAGNKVGGIYTVLQSKTRETKKIYKENYYLIGAYNEERAKGDLNETQPPVEIAKIFQKLEPLGIKFKFGKWAKGDDCNLILIDAKEFSQKYVDGMKRVDLIKKELWEVFGVDSYNADPSFDEPVAWSTAAGLFLEEFAKNNEKKIVAHTHEWLSGPCLLYLRSVNAKIGLVFTTHATTFGRTKSGDKGSIMKEVVEGLKDGRVADINEVRRYNITAKHLTEVASAKNADVFTTVSDVTAQEAEYVLGVKPQVITYNAMDLDRFPDINQLIEKHVNERQNMNQFLESYFGSYFDIKTKDSIVMYTCGRYEFANKGLDVFIQALGKLNQKLIEEKYDKEVFVFLWVPAHVKEMKEEVQDNQLMYDSIQNFVNKNILSIKKSMVTNIALQKPLAQSLPKDIVSQARLLSYKYRKNFGRNAPLSAFDIHNEHFDPIINALKSNGLNNSKDDKVRVIFYPIYLSISDELLSMDIYTAMAACDVGVFPSAYEPWGYTGGEAASMLNLAVTSDLAGYGKFTKPYIKDEEPNSIYVLERLQKSDSEASDALSKHLHKITKLSVGDLLEKKLLARDLVKIAEWKVQIKKYLLAHNMALSKVEK